MILELADIRIQPGQQAAFDEGIVRGVTTVIAKAKVFRGWKVNKGMESPEPPLQMLVRGELNRPSGAARTAGSPRSDAILPGEHGLDETRGRVP